MINEILKTSKDIIYDMPFYGGVLLSLHKEVDNKITNTACVGLNGVAYKIIFNSDFWETLSNNHKKGLLLHELGHIINFHLTEYEHLTNKNIANIAMDIYINQTIPNELLPPNACTWDKYKDLKPNKDTNWYYKKLIKNNEDKSDQCLENCLSDMDNGKNKSKDVDGNEISLPNHKWEDIQNASDAKKKMLEKNTGNLIKNIAKQIKLQHGNIPGNIEEILEKLNEILPPKFNWKGFVRRFIGTSTKTWSYKTRRKRSKRFRGMPGLKEKFFSNILVAVDTSLSVDENDLREFHNELVHIHKTGHDIQILLCDTEIRREFKFNPRNPFNIDGRGGTDFQPVINMYNNNIKKYSCLIYLTDGEASVPKNAKGNILWVHGTNHSINHKLPGRKIKLEL